MKKGLLYFLFLICNCAYAQNYSLISLSVNGVNDSWCGDVEEVDFFGCWGDPDLFVQITDNSGNLILSSTTFTNSNSFELTINLTLDNFPYTLEVFDYDEISNNDNLGSFTLDSSQNGIFTLSNGGTSISINLMQSFPGCMDINATNYDSIASMNDGSCEYLDCLTDEDLILVEMQTDSWGFESSISVSDFLGQVYLSIPDFTDNSFHSFSVCVPNSDMYSFTINDEMNNGICCNYGDGSYNIYVCGDLIASGGNFGESESITIESCDYQSTDLLGCMDPFAFNFNSLANIDDENCLYFDCPSNVIPDANNLFYPPDGSVIVENFIQLPIAAIGYIYQEYIQFYAPNQLDLDGTSIQFNNVQINEINNLPLGLDYQCSSGNCGFSSNEIGCIGLLGTPLESGSFELAISASVSVSYDAGILGNIEIDFDIPYYGGNTWLDFAGVDASVINSIVPNITLIVQESSTVYGCTDPLANNYDPFSNVDDSSCDYQLICDGTSAVINLQTTSFSDDVSWEVLNTSGEIILASSLIYQDNSEYIINVCLNVDEYYFVNAIDSSGDGWMNAKFDISIYCDSNLFSLLNVSPTEGYLNEYSLFVSCNTQLGCNDSEALNFDSIVNINDGSCIYPLFGCTNQLALNYNPLAFIDDNSCTIFECPELEVSEAGFFPPYGSTFNEDSSYVYLPNGYIEEFYDQNLQFYSDELITIEGLEVGFISAKINQVNNMPEGMYYQTSSEDSTFYPQNTGCVGLFGYPENTGTYNLSIDATVTVEVLGSPISFNLPYQGGVAILDLIFSDGNYSSLNNFIPTFVIEVISQVDNIDVLGCQDVYATNFDYLATSDDTSCLYSQDITLSGGWNFFSTYITPEINDIIQVCASLENNIIILKNNEGDAYLPEWNFNGIGDIVIGQGYQMKLIESSILNINGSLILPELYPIELTQGWNLIAYLRINPANSVAILEEIVQAGNLVIAKDNQGNAYLPEFSFNGIGDFSAGKGYQLKVMSSQYLNYLSNQEDY